MPETSKPQMMEATSQFCGSHKRPRGEKIEFSNPHSVFVDEAEE